jgi:hypothetical protein
MYINHQQDDWADWLPLAEFSYNNSVNKVTGYTPFFLNKGCHLRMLMTDPLDVHDTPAGKYLKAIRDAAGKAELSLRKAKDAMKQWRDRSEWKEEEFSVGDLVLISSDHLPSTRPSKKLDNKWRGPFRVISQKGPSAYELDLPTGWKGYCIFNCSRIKCFIPPMFPVQESQLRRPDPELMKDRTEEYEVEEVLDKRSTARGVEYLVRWEGCGPEDDTWEEASNLGNAKGAVWDYEVQGQTMERRGHHVMDATITEEDKGLVKTGRRWTGLWAGWFRLETGLQWLRVISPVLAGMTHINQTPMEVILISPMLMKVILISLVLMEVKRYNQSKVKCLGLRDSQMVQRSQGGYVSGSWLWSTGRLGLIKR